MLAEKPRLSQSTERHEPDPHCLFWIDGHVLRHGQERPTAQVGAGHWLVRPARMGMVCLADAGLGSGRDLRGLFAGLHPGDSDSVG